MGWSTTCTGSVGMFTEEGIHAHLVNHVDYVFADYTRDILRQRLKPGSRVLASGAALAVRGSPHARRFGAFGVEIAAFKVDFARPLLFADGSGFTLYFPPPSPPCASALR